MGEQNLKKTRSFGRSCIWISRLALMLAAAMLVLTVKTCCPDAVQRAKAWLGLGETGKVRSAFSALTDALAGGDDVVTAFAQSYQALTGETS